MLLGLRVWALYHLNALGDSAGQVIVAGEPLVADSVRVLGADHPDTLQSRNNLGEAYRVAGRAAEAIPLHQQTLAAFERVLGPDHPGTLASRNNLAVAYGAAGRSLPDRAGPRMRRHPAVPVRRRRSWSGRSRKNRSGSSPA